MVESLGLRISKSEVSRICQGLDEQFTTDRKEGAVPKIIKPGGA